MHTTNTMSSHCLLPRAAKFYKSNNTECWQLELSYIFGGNEKWKKVWKFLKKLNIHFFLWPRNSTPTYLLKKKKIYAHKDLSKNVISIAMWINCYIHTMEFHSAIKRKRLLLHTTTWRNRRNIIWMKEATHKTALDYSIYMKF